MEKIIVTIDRTGKAEVRVEGVKGARCLEVSKQVEDAIGVQGHFEITSEFYESAAQTGTVEAQQ